MSLTGKILTLMNMMGAIGLLSLALLDFNARHKWSHSVFVHDLLLRGLPLDEAEVDSENVPIVARLAEKGEPAASSTAASTLFQPVGGNPVTTQKEEVERVKKETDGKLQAVQGPAQQAYQLSRILFYLSDDYIEREQLVACRAHLATDATAKALQARAAAAFARAKHPAFQPQRNLAEAFRLAFRLEGGPPAEMFVTILLREMGTDDRARLDPVNFDQVYAKAVQAQRDGLMSRYAALFDEALGKAPQAETPTSTPGTQLQKAAIARLLLGLSPYLAEEAARPVGESDRFAYQSALFRSQPFRERFLRRVYIVCGLKPSVQALTDRTAVVRRLTEYVNNSVGQERDQFVLDHTILITAVREQAALVRAEEALIKESEEKINGTPGVEGTGLRAVTEARDKEIKSLTTELSESRAETARVTSQLRNASQELVELRQLIRDAIRDTSVGEKRIRELEKQIRDLDAKR